MKVKTFRNILITVYIAYFFCLNIFEKQLLPLIFGESIPTLYEFSSLLVWLKIIPIPFALVSLWNTFKAYSLNKMTKKAYALLILLFTFLMALPLLLYPSRTEITAERITKHNLIGQETAVYEIKDAEKVTAGLVAVGGSRGRAYINFVYSIEFADGFTYELTHVDEDKWWSVIDKIDDTVTENGVEKMIIGENYFEDSFEVVGFSEIYERIDTVNKIMERYETE